MTDKQSNADYDGWGKASEIVEFAEEFHELACTVDGETIAIPKSGPRQPVSIGPKGGALKGRIMLMIYESKDKVVEADSLSAAMKIVHQKALGLKDRIETHVRVASLPGSIVIDLGRPNSSECVIVNRDGWRVADQPPTGVLFRRTAATQPLPIPVEDGSFEPLRAVLALSGDNWDLIRGWLVGSLMADVPRPVLVFTGAAGSGKSVRAKAVIDVLDPRERLGGTFGEKLEDDRVQALGRFLVGYDNLSKMSGHASDHLCRLVTGEVSEKRMLYSDTETSRIAYMRTGVMTAIDVPNMKSDALERIIPIELDTMRAADRRSEMALRVELAKAHPEALGAVLDGAVTMLRNLPGLADKDHSGPRMRDYWRALKAYDGTCADAYARSAHGTLRDEADGDPFVQTIIRWVGAEDGFWQGTADDGLKRAREHRIAHDDGTVNNAWWPANPRAFSVAINKQARPLESVGIRVAKGRRKRTARPLYVGLLSHPDWEPMTEEAGA